MIWLVVCCLSVFLNSFQNQVHPERCYSYLDDDKAAAPPVGAPIGCDVNKSKVEAPVEGGSLKLTASSSNAITARKLYSDLVRCAVTNIA